MTYENLKALAQRLFESKKDTEYVIWNNTLYTPPFYGGDYYHSSIISNSTKSDLLNNNVIEVSSFEELDLFFFGMANIGLQWVSLTPNGVETGVYDTPESKENLLENDVLPF